MALTLKYVELPIQVTLPYYEQGSPSGIPLILVPGFADSSCIFEPLLPHLPESIHTFAITLRGHGDASRPASGYHTEDFVSDLDLFMKAVRINKVVLAGASSGGFVTRRFAATHPEQTLGLVLLGAPSALNKNPKFLDAWHNILSKLTDIVDPDFVRAFSKNIFTKPMPLEFVNKIVGENMKVPARVWRETGEGLLLEDFPGDLNPYYLGRS
jgi:pimeloyl-ACP methyl ester carboxylesterase